VRVAAAARAPAAGIGRQLLNLTLTSQQNRIDFAGQCGKTAKMAYINPPDLSQMAKQFSFKTG